MITVKKTAVVFLTHLGDVMITIPKTAVVLVDGGLIQVRDIKITASRVVRNIGVVVYRHLDFKKEVSSIVSVC